MERNSAIIREVVWCGGGSDPAMEEPGKKEEKENKGNGAGRFKSVGGIAAWWNLAEEGKRREKTVGGVVEGRGNFGPQGQRGPASVS